jgi:hypothetical protein
MPLSNSEIQAAREKLRDKYDKLAAKYGSMFSYARVDERYMQSLKERLPLERFLANEVQILKDLEARAEEIFAPPPEYVPTSADRMLEEFAARIQAYPPLEFSKRADDETKRLAGALADFYERFGQGLPVARSLPPGTKAAKLADALRDRVFHQLEAVRVGSHPRILLDLGLALERITTGDRERERLCKTYTKEAGFLCNLLSDFLGELLASQYAEEAVLGDAFLQSERARFEAAKTEVDAVTHAFRLREFRLASLE